MRSLPWSEYRLWRRVQGHREAARRALDASVHPTHDNWLSLMRADKLALQHLRAAEALLTRAKVTR